MVALANPCAPNTRRAAVISSDRRNSLRTSSLRRLVFIAGAGVLRTGRPGAGQDRGRLDGRCSQSADRTVSISDAQDAPWIPGPEEGLRLWALGYGPFRLGPACYANPRRAQSPKPNA